MHAHTDKALRSRLGIGRSIRISKGDTVKVMCGSKKGATGKVSGVRLRSGYIHVEGLMRKNARGKELRIPIRPENVYIIDIDASDRRRMQRLQQRHGDAAVQRAAQQPAAQQRG